MEDTDYRREQVCYEQNFEQARSLNTHMHQVPVIAMTLTGGLWFGAGVTENLHAEMRFSLLLFAGFCNISLSLAIIRIRDVLENYLEKIRNFHPKSFVSGNPNNPRLPGLGNYGTIFIYCALMLMGGLISFLGAFSTYWPFAFSEWFGVGILIIVLMILYLLIFRGNAASNHESQNRDAKPRETSN